MGKSTKTINSHFAKLVWHNQRVACLAMFLLDLMRDLLRIFGVASHASRFRRLELGFSAGDAGDMWYNVTLDHGGLSKMFMNQ